MRTLAQLFALPFLLLQGAGSGSQVRIDGAGADALARSGGFLAARDAYRSLVAADPQDGRSYARLAEALFALRDYRGAVEAFTRASELCPPERADALYGRACACAQLGEFAESLRSLELALDAGLLNVRAIEVDPDLAPLRGQPGFRDVALRALGPWYGVPLEARSPTTEEKRACLRFTVETILARHPAPCRLRTRAQWQAELEAALVRAEGMDEAALLVELMGLTSWVGDVHTSAYPGPLARVMQRAVPLAFWKFPDGLRVRAAQPEFAALLGAEVIAFGDTLVAELWPRLVRRFPFENEWMAANDLAFYLRFPDFLRGLGLSGDPAASSLRLRFADGSERTLRIPAAERGFARETETRGFALPTGWLEAGPEPQPLWLERRGVNYWATALPEARAIYFQFNLPRDDRAHPWAEFLEELVAKVRREHAERLIVDLRHNPGGWGYMAYDLERRLREVPEITRPGHLFVLISRVTQSAGVVIAAELERLADALFVGEPLGAHPNFFNGPRGNHPPLLLPGTGFHLRVSEVQEQHSDSLDPRRFIAPDLRAPLDWATFSSGGDPALEAALDIEPMRAARLLNDVGDRPLDPSFRFERPTQYWAWGDASEHPVP
jgi:hypothetical protein